MSAWQGGRAQGPFGARVGEKEEHGRDDEGEVGGRDGARRYRLLHASSLRGRRLAGELLGAGMFAERFPEAKEGRATKDLHDPAAVEFEQGGATADGAAGDGTGEGAEKVHESGG